MKVYCSLDDIITDFEGAVRNLIGTSVTSVSPKKVWAILERTSSFFETLPWKNDAKLLWRAVRSIGPTPTTILTTCPPKLKSIKKEKRRWCKRELGSSTRVEILSSRRKIKYCCCPGDILIDNRKELGSAWEAAGGIFILHENNAHETIESFHAAIKIHQGSVRIAVSNIDFQEPLPLHARVDVAMVNGVVDEEAGEEVEVLSVASDSSSDLISLDSCTACDRCNRLSCVCTFAVALGVAAGGGKDALSSLSISTKGPSLPDKQHNDFVEINNTPSSSSSKQLPQPETYQPPGGDYSHANPTIASDTLIDSNERFGSPYLYTDWPYHTQQGQAAGRRQGVGTLTNADIMNDDDESSVLDHFQEVVRMLVVLLSHSATGGLMSLTGTSEEYSKLFPTEWSKIQTARVFACECLGWDVPLLQEGYDEKVWRDDSSSVRSFSGDAPVDPTSTATAAPPLSRGGGNTTSTVPRAVNSTNNIAADTVAVEDREDIRWMRLTYLDYALKLPNTARKDAYVQSLTSLDEPSVVKYITDCAAYVRTPTHSSSSSIRTGTTTTSAGCIKSGVSGDGTCNDSAKQVAAAAATAATSTTNKPTSVFTRLLAAVRTDTPKGFNQCPWVFQSKRHLTAFDSALRWFNRVSKEASLLCSANSRAWTSSSSAGGTSSSFSSRPPPPPPPSFLLLGDLGKLLDQVVTGQEEGFVSAFRDRLTESTSKTSSSAAAAAAAVLLPTSRRGVVGQNSIRRDVQNGVGYEEAAQEEEQQLLPADFEYLSNFEKLYHLNRVSKNNNNNNTNNNNNRKRTAPPGNHATPHLPPKEPIDLDACVLEFSGLALQWTDDDERRCSEEFLDAKLYQYYPLWPIGRGLCIIIEALEREAQTLKYTDKKLCCCCYKLAIQLCLLLLRQHPRSYPPSVISSVALVGPPPVTPSSSSSSSTGSISISHGFAVLQGLRGYCWERVLVDMGHLGYPFEDINDVWKRAMDDSELTVESHITLWQRRKAIQRSQAHKARQQRREYFSGPAKKKRRIAALKKLRDSSAAAAKVKAKAKIKAKTEAKIRRSTGNREAVTTASTAAQAEVVSGGALSWSPTVLAAGAEVGDDVMAKRVEALVDSYGDSSSNSSSSSEESSEEEDADDSGDDDKYEDEEEGEDDGGDDQDTPPRLSTRVGGTSSSATGTSSSSTMIVGGAGAATGRIVTAAGRRGSDGIFVRESTGNQRVYTSTPSAAPTRRGNRLQFSVPNNRPQRPTNSSTGNGTPIPNQAILNVDHAPKGTSLPSSSLPSSSTGTGTGIVRRNSTCIRPHRAAVDWKWSGAIQWNRYYPTTTPGASLSNSRLPMSPTGRPISSTYFAAPGTAVDPVGGLLTDSNNSASRTRDSEELPPNVCVEVLAMYHYLCAIADGSTLNDFCSIDAGRDEKVVDDKSNKGRDRVVGCVEIDMSLYERGGSNDSASDDCDAMPRRMGFVGGRASAAPAAVMTSVTTTTATTCIGSSSSSRNIASTSADTTAAPVAALVSSTKTPEKEEDVHVPVKEGEKEEEEEWLASWSESKLWVPILFLLMWEQIFLESLSYCCPRMFLTRPIDFLPEFYSGTPGSKRDLPPPRSNGFFVRRRTQILERLAQLKAMSSEQLGHELMASFTRNEGSPCYGIDWELVCPNELRSLVECIGGARLSLILERMVCYPETYMRGVPDLLFWKLKKQSTPDPALVTSFSAAATAVASTTNACTTNASIYSTGNSRKDTTRMTGYGTTTGTSWLPNGDGVFAVEVKSVNDRLSRWQILWLQLLQSAGIHAEVLKIL